MLPEAVTAWVAQRTWLWWTAAGLAPVLALIGLRWLIAQLRVHQVCPGGHHR